MKKTVLLTIVSLFIVTFFTQCYNQPTYAPEPLIDFKYVSIVDSIDSELENEIPIVSIAFKVIDGDGNFGFEEDTLFYNGDTIPYNFYCEMYELIDNQEVKYEETILDGRIPWVTPVGLNEYYKATVIYNLPLYYVSAYPIKFKFYVIDNEANISNTQSTMWLEPDFRGTLTDSINFIED